MIERLLIDGNYQAGVYAQAYRLLEGFNMFGYLFAGLLLPIFSRMIKENKAISNLLRTSFNLLFIPSIAIALLSFQYSETIMDLLYVENIDSSAEIYGILMFSFVAIALSYIYGTLLTANGSLKELNLISALGLLLNLLLNLWLIPIYFAKGAAIATLITQAMVICCQVFFSWKIFRLKIELSYLARNFGIMIMIILSAIYLKMKFDHFALALAIIAILNAILPVIFGLIKPSDVLKILKKDDSA
jgi:O-antigen/teichoic acid export membrane protein